MLKEALDRFSELVSDTRPQVVELPGDNPNHHLLLGSDGWHEFIHNAPPPRQHHTAQLRAFADAAAQNVGVSDEQAKLVVYNAWQARMLFDASDPSQYLAWISGATDEWTFFHGANTPGGVALEVRQAVDLFDLNFRETLGDPKLLTKLGKLKVVSETMAEAQKDASSSLTGGISKKRISEDTPLPEGEVTFYLQASRNTPQFKRIPVRCYLRADLNERRWVFRTVPSSWAQAEEDAAEQVGEYLRKDLADYNVAVVPGELGDSPASQPQEDSPFDD